MTREKGALFGMMKLIALAVISLQLVLALVEAVDRKPLSCASNLNASTFDAFKSVCGAIYTKDRYDSIAHRLEPENRLDLIETCSCALVNHDLAWASMLTHEGETLFLAIKKFIDDSDRFLDEYHSITGEKDEARANALREQFDNQVQIRSAVSRDELVALLGEEGGRQYYWDRLTQIVRDANDENNCDKVAAYVQRAFGLMLYEPENMSYKLAKSVKQNSLLIPPDIRTRFSRTCWLLIRDFYPFTVYITRLSDLADNPRFFYQLSTYSEHLYKLRMNTLMCKFLEKTGKLTGRDEVLKKYRLPARKNARSGSRSRADLKSRRFVESDSEDSSEYEEDSQEDSDQEDDDDDDDDDLRRRRQYKSRSG